MESKYSEALDELLERLHFLKNSEDEDIIAFQTVRAKGLPVFITVNDIRSNSGKVLTKNVMTIKDLVESLKRNIGLGSATNIHEKIESEVKRIYLTLREEILSFLEKGEKELIAMIPKNSTVRDFMDEVVEKKLEDENSFRDKLEEILVYLGSTGLDFNPDDFLTNIIRNSTEISKEIENQIGKMNNVLSFIPRDSTIMLERDHRFLNNLIDSVNPNPRWHLLFRLGEHGNTATEFHKLCDNQGPTVCLFKTKGGKRFGGFCSLPWKSDGSREVHPDTFTFSLDLKEKYMFGGGRSTGEIFSSYNSISNGPYFGSDKG